MTEINNLADLKNTAVDSFAETFMHNLSSIFQYTQTDIIEVIDIRCQNTLAVLRQKLCDEIKVSFPMYQQRRPISRKAKHLIAQDIFHLGYSLVNESVSCEAEKAFHKAGNEDAGNEDEEQEENRPAANGELAKLIAAVAELQQAVNSLKTENKKLTKRIDEMPICKCAADHAGQPNNGERTEDPETSNGPVVEEAVQAGGSQVDAAVTVSSSSSSHPSSDTESESDDQSRNRRKRKKPKRSSGANNNKCFPKKQASKTSDATSPNQVTNNNQPKSHTQLKAASPSPVVKEIYVGNVDPENSISDIVDHIKLIASPIGPSDVRELYKGHDAKSFCVKVPENNFNKVISAVWPTGIKVRKFYPKSNGAQQNKNQAHRRGAQGPQKGIKASNRTSQGQYARQPRNRPNTYQKQPFRSYQDQRDWYDSEWPPLHRAREDYQWDYQNEGRYYDTSY